MSLERIAETLRVATGLDVETLGPGALALAVGVRRPGASPAELAVFAEAVRTDPAVRRDLLADLLVHETSFFRYPGAFALLVELARARLAVPEARFRVLSAPCSTGQEPASVAMALIEADLDLARVRIDAVDVSAGAVARARAALYGEIEMRGLDDARRARFLRREGAGWRVNREVLAPIHPEAADLLDPGFAVGREPYDAILCRNLLIYLTADARRVVLERMRSLLAPGGVLLVGHAEVLPARDAGFGGFGPPEAYAVAVLPRRPPGPEPTPRVERWERRASPRPPARVPYAPVPARPRAPEPAPAETPLAQARRLADGGREVEALALLGRDEAAGHASPDAFHLAALLARALGKADEADRALTRALYLDPRHVPALRLAALRARERGEVEAAERFEARAERAHAAGSER